MKRKKSIKMRGSRTHGYGSHKKHRGAGSRGGRGMAGVKRSKKTWILKYKKDHLGKRGFKSLSQRKITEQSRSVNVGDIGRMKGIDRSKEIDLGKMGFTRVLGKGRLTEPLSIRAEYFTEKARQKIEEVKGKAISAEPAEESG